MAKEKLNNFEHFVAEQFGKIDERSNNFEHFVAEQFGKIESKLNMLENTQDFMQGDLKSLNEEKTVGAYRSKRMESWVEKAAKKLDLPYNP